MKINQKSRVIINIILAIIFFGGIKTAYAKDLYVSPTGDDSVAYADNTLATPWKTVSKAFRLYYSRAILFISARGPILLM